MIMGIKTLLVVTCLAMSDSLELTTRCGLSQFGRVRFGTLLSMRSAFGALCLPQLWAFPFVWLFQVISTYAL